MQREKTQKYNYQRLNGGSLWAMDFHVIFFSPLYPSVFPKSLQRPSSPFVTFTVKEKEERWREREGEREEEKRERQKVSTVLTNTAVFPQRNNTKSWKTVQFVFLSFGKGLTTMPLREN